MRSAIVARESSTVLLADINRDGSLDLVTKNYTNQTVCILLGNGRWGFTLAPTKSLSQDFGPGYVALVDLNKDGALDLIVASKEAVTNASHRSWPAAKSASRRGTPHARLSWV